MIDKYVETRAKELFLQFSVELCFKHETGLVWRWCPESLQFSVELCAAGVLPAAVAWTILSYNSLLSYVELRSP